MRGLSEFDVAIVGAGPAGCASALAFAREGKRVLVLEADPRASDRLAGEWLHPPALAILDRLGVDLTPARPYATGKGFVVFPDDGSAPIALPYAAGSFGLAIEHALLVETLRAHCEREPSIELLPWARATRVDGQSLTFERPSALERAGASGSGSGRNGAGARGLTTHTVTAKLIVGASGRTATFRAPELGGHALPDAPAASSRIAGLSLEGVALPFEGYLHVFLGGPGPVMAYRIDPRRVRVLCDVPLSLPIPREGDLPLFESYVSVLAPELRHAFREALRARDGRSAPEWASIDLRPRVDHGREGLALVGDAVGAHHPLTASDLTLALEDAATLARARSFAEYRRTRLREARVPEMLAVGLYEVFADESEETVATRRAIYELWREKPGERLRSMGFLSGEDRNHLRFARSFLSTLLRGSRDFVRDALSTGRVLHTGRVASDLGQRIAWLLGGTLHLTESLPAKVKERIRGPRTAEERYGAALRASSAMGEVVGLPRGDKDEGPSARDALRRGVAALIAQQADDGSFEGEVTWGPVLAAQYVLAWHAMGRRIDPGRRAGLLLHFDRTRLEGGAWGMDARGEPYLFVTTLVYVACRLLGVERDDPRIAGAYELIRREGGAARVPTWGKLWLAVVGLYAWQGVSAMIPEAWHAPRWLPIHPSRYQSHARLAFLGMAVLFGEKWSAPITPRILAIRDEIFPGGWDAVDFEAAREALRDEEMATPWPLSLRLGYRALGAVDRLQSRDRRAHVLAELREQIRYELRSTSHTCISPVSGLLDQVALFVEDPEDPDLRLAAERFEAWIWEDDELGTRITGARSATWDTSWAAQALIAARAASPGAATGEIDDALRRADEVLVRQQIRRASGRERDHDRIDPTGGYCHAGAWHGWAVSDATAEAMLARLGAPGRAAGHEEMAHAVRFLLRCQNSDGGFGSHEPRRGRLPIDWLRPGEVLGGSLTERSHVEHTGSAIAALSAFARRWPESELAEAALSAARRAVALLRRSQRPDGSWSGTRGVHFVCGTMFGVRGLLAGGVPAHDPQIRRACAFLKDRQRPDGAWGEHRSSVRVGRWVEDEEGHAVQTAWALSALLEARDPEFGASMRAAQWLMAAQLDGGSWATQAPEGVFFDTAPIDHALHRLYFPVRALALYEVRRAERARFRERADSPARPRAHV